MVKTILVVDDEPHILRAMERVLGLYGFEVLTATDGREAVELARRFPIDAVLIDVTLGRESGDTVATNLLCVHPSLRIVFVSGHSRDTLEDFGMCPGGRFVAKPVDLEDLEAALSIRPPAYCP